MTGLLDWQNTEILQKLLLPTAMIIAAFFAGRRWGEGIGGLLVALPLTSGWVAFFLARDFGAHFATDAAMGSLAGTIGQAAFALVYALAATRRPWPVCLALACVSFMAPAWIMSATISLLPQPGMFLLTAGALAGTAWLITTLDTGTREVRTPGQSPWVRAGVTVLTILCITAASQIIGPWLSGLLATFPTLGAIVVCFSHRGQGARVALRALRGFSLGLSSTAGFFIAILCCLDRFGIGITFSAAIATALLTQAAMLLVILRASPATPPVESGNKVGQSWHLIRRPWNG